MFETKIKIDGMACGMCEAHVCDALRRNLNLKKVTASHIKNQAVIISENPLTQAEVITALDGTGYRVLTVECGEYEKRSLFSFLKKKK